MLLIIQKQREYVQKRRRIVLFSDRLTDDLWTSISHQYHFSDWMITTGIRISRKRTGVITCKYWLCYQHHKKSVSKHMVIGGHIL